MKELLGLAMLGCLMLSSAANAAVYSVNFNTTVGDDAYAGYFTYDTAGLDLNGENFNNGNGLELSLIVKYAENGVAGSFDDTTAGVSLLEFDSGTLVDWAIGGNANGPNTFDSRTVGQADAVLDFVIRSGYDSRFSFGEQLGYPSVENWSAQQVSAVPLPGAVWAFGAGLLGLLGLKRRRRKMKMLRTATA